MLNISTLLIEDNSFHALLCKNPTICNKCFQKFNPVLQRFSVQNLDGLYVYNYDEIIKDKLYQLKGCFDIELASIFLEYYASYLNIKYFGYVIVPAPSYIDADTLVLNDLSELFEIDLTDYSVAGVIDALSNIFKY